MTRRSVEALEFLSRSSLSTQTADQPGVHFRAHRVRTPMEGLFGAEVEPVFTFYFSNQIVEVRSVKSISCTTRKSSRARSQRAPAVDWFFWTASNSTVQQSGPRTTLCGPKDQFLSWTHHGREVTFCFVVFVDHRLGEARVNHRLQHHAQFRVHR